MDIKFLVIGSNSFTGSHFINYCLDKKDKVIGISRSKELKEYFLVYKKNKNLKKKFKFYQYDLNKDLYKIINLIKKKKPTHIVNFASQSMVAQSWETPLDWYNTNVISSVKFIKLIKEFKFIKKFVHISTPEVYGNTSKNLKENSIYNPTTPYAISRACFDMHLMQEAINFNFPVVFTRAANVYGPGQQLYRIIPRTILFIKQGKKLQLHGGGHSERSFIHIDDVSDATLKIALNGMIGETYHISTKSSITIRNLVSLICAKMNANFDDCVDIVEDRPGKDAAYLLNSNKLRGSLDWADYISLDAGIDQVINWVDSNIDILAKELDYYVHKK